MSFSVMLQQLAGGMLVSIEIFFITLLFSLPLGLLICFGRMSRNKVIRTIVSGYISIMRGTPLMLQLMVVYFGPYFIFGIRISMGYSLIAVFIAFAINYAAYFAEIYRGGIESMPVGQYEAAKILGYNKVQTFFRIILPQVIKRICRLLRMRSLRWSRILPLRLLWQLRRCLPLPSRSQVHRRP